MVISRNVVYTNLENILKTDVVEIDINTKNTKFLCMTINKRLILRVKIKWE